jgi:Fur family transcriptional regulator, peroxide stress response regulator
MSRKMNKINEIILNLKEKGVKVTPQRVAIIDFLEKNKIHPTADEIYENVSKTFPSISLATIYNTLEKLEEIGAITKIKISDENKVNYEAILEPHHHFYCRKCKKIFDIDIKCSFSILKEVEGNKIEEIHGYFKGICKNCL